MIHVLVGAAMVLLAPAGGLMALAIIFLAPIVGDNEDDGWGLVYAFCQGVAVSLFVAYVLVVVWVGFRVMVGGFY